MTHDRHHRLAKVAILTCALYGLLYAATEIILFFGYPTSNSTLVLIPTPVDPYHAAYQLNPYGLALVLVTVAAYAVGLALWVRGRGRPNTLLIVLIAALSVTLISVVVYESLAGAAMLGFGARNRLVEGLGLIAKVFPADIEWRFLPSGWSRWCWRTRSSGSSRVLGRTTPLGQLGTPVDAHLTDPGRLLNMPLVVVEDRHR